MMMKENQMVDIDGYTHVINGKVVCFTPDVTENTELPDTAILEDEVEQIIDPDAEDILWFSLKKGDISFKIGLSDILMCLKFAEEQKEVPKLPWEWWSKVTGVYPKLDLFLSDALSKMEKTEQLKKR